MKYPIFLLLISVSLACSKKQIANFQPSKREIFLSEKEKSSPNVVRIVAEKDSVKPEIIVIAEPAVISNDTIKKETDSFINSKPINKIYKPAVADSSGKVPPNYEGRAVVAGSLAISTLIIGFMANIILHITAPFIIFALIAAIVGGILGINSVKKVKNKTLAIIGIVIGAFSTLILLGIAALAYLLRNMDGDR